MAGLLAYFQKNALNKAYNGGFKTSLLRFIGEPFHGERIANLYKNGLTVKSTV